MQPVVVQKVTKVIFDRYNNVTLFSYIMHINGIEFLNTIYQNFLFAMRSMIKNRKMKNVEEGIKQVKKLYLKRGFKIICIHYDNEFEPLQPEVADIVISLNFMSKK